MSDVRVILRAVELTPAEAALAYLLVANVDTPRGRARDAVSILNKCEAAMEPELAPVQATDSSSAQGVPSRRGK